MPRHRNEDVVEPAVTISPLITRSETIHGVILLMGDHEERQERASGDARRAATPAGDDGKRER